ncbi:MAG TPA: cytochrome c-type biogenesis protein [Solimonas sp.]|nr:cytochrome c-type biogenesis protein [Solimonas sp.]
MTTYAPPSSPRMRGSKPRHWMPAFAGMTMVLAAAFADAAELNADQLQRYQKMTSELRCLVCQNQSISESNAPLAADLRNQVRDQILAGRSDAEIADYVTARYGDFVLYKPPLRPVTLLLWLGPGLGVLLALAAAFMFVRRSRGVTAPVLDEAALKELLQPEERAP